MIWSILAVWTQVASLQRYQGDDCAFNTRLVRSLPVSLIGFQLTLDGRKLIGQSLNYSEVRDSKSGLVSQQIPKGTTDFIFTPSGDMIFWNTSQLNEMRAAFTGATATAWSPDGKRLITITYSFTIYILSIWTSSGVLVKQWIEQFTPTALCWSPGKLISIVGLISTEGVAIWYHSNGTRAFSTKIDRNWASSAALAHACSSRSIMAMSGLALVDTAGRVIVRDNGELYPIFDNNRNALVACGMTWSKKTCTIYDSSLEILLELPGTVGHYALGFTRDRMLITSTLQATYWWDVATPQVDVYTDQISSLRAGIAWIDRDTILAGQMGSFLREFNVRTQQFGATYPITFGLCIMGDEAYILLSDGGTVAVWKQGQEVRRWKTLPKVTTFGCSHGHVWTGFNNNILVWMSTGRLLQNTTLSFKPLFFSLHNMTRVAAISNNYDLYVGNLVTNQVDLIHQMCFGVGWSPDGNWLLVQYKSSTEDIFWSVWSVLHNNNKLVIQGFSGAIQVVTAQTWSADSNWLLIGTPLLLVSPKLNITTSVPFGNSDSVDVYWNPETMEVLSISMLSPLRLWDPTPKILGVFAQRRVGVSSSAVVSMLGANFFSSPVHTMLRWVDSSTSRPQCFFINATVVDPWTLSLGNITLPDPAMYTVYIRHSTTDQSSPWVSWDSQFAATCGNNTLPAISLAGDVTKCVCPHDYYTVPDIAELICETCPLYGICNGTTVVVSEQGYWPRSEDPYQFLSCAAGACPGDNQCLSCHEGPICGLCQRGCGQHGFGRCQKCKPVWADMLLVILGLLCWIVFCTIQSLFALGWRNKKSGENNSAQLAASIVSTTQMNALLLSVDVKVDSLSRTLGYTEEATQGGGIQSAVLSCVLINTGWSPGHVHFVKQIIMLLLPVIGWIALIGLRALLKWRGVVTSTDVVKVPTVVLWASLQSAISTSFFQTLSCDIVNSQNFKSRLKHDISVPCYGSTYWSFVTVITIPAVILTTVIIPLTIGWLLRYRPSASDSGHLRFLVKSFRFDWWYLVIFYRKILLCIVVTSTKNPFHVAVTLMLSSALNLLVWPSTSFVVNVSETLSQMVSALIFAVAGAVSVETSHFGAAELLCIGVFAYCVQIGLLIYDRWEGKEKKKDDEAESVMLEPIDNFSNDETKQNNHLYARLLDQ